MKRGARVAAVMALLAAMFLWGFAAHRSRLFPYALVSYVLPDTPAKPYTWVQSSNRPLQRLAALSYVGSAYDPDHDRSGVQLHDTDHAQPGLNFYYSAFRGPYRLIDNDGVEVHSWSYPDDGVAHAELLPDGSLILVLYERKVVRIDRDSRVLWEAAVRAHHDVWVHDDEVWVTARDVRVIPEIHPDQPAYDDTLAVLGLVDGAVRRQISLFDIVQRSPYAFLLPSADLREFVPADGPLDALHSNHVQVFDGSLAAQSPLFAAGNFMVSLRHLNAVFIVGGASQEILWIWGPSNIWAQHHPTLLPDGRVLLLDNGFVKSRVIEVDPRSDEIVWSWTDDAFFTALRGSVQRLANGNTLITESDTGYVFEITRAGETVWEFANPDVSPAGERGVIWRLTRFQPGELEFLPAGG